MLLPLEKEANLFSNGGIKYEKNVFKRAITKAY